MYKKHPPPCKARNVFIHRSCQARERSEERVVRSEVSQFGGPSEQWSYYHADKERDLWFVPMDKGPLLSTECLLRTLHLVLLASDMGQFMDMDCRMEK